MVRLWYGRVSLSSPRSLEPAMYPVTHAVIAGGVVWAAQRLAGRPRAALDLRFAALGALAPDAIDKPLHILLASIFTDGHTVGHTLLFSLALVSAGTVLALRGDPRLLAFGLGSLTHPLVDPVLVYPGTLFWPLFGFGFPDVRGIPGWYLRGADVALVLAVIVGWNRSAAFRERARRFLRSGLV